MMGGGASNFEFVSFGFVFVVEEYGRQNFWKEKKEPLLGAGGNIIRIGKRAGGSRMRSTIVSSLSASRKKKANTPGEHPFLKLFLCVVSSRVQRSWHVASCRVEGREHQKGSALAIFARV